jgi:hypothetical protein
MSYFTSINYYAADSETRQACCVGSVGLSISGSELFLNAYIYRSESGLEFSNYYLQKMENRLAILGSK